MKLLLLVVATLFVAGCSQEKKEQGHTQNAVATQEVKKPAVNVVPKENKSIAKEVAVVHKTRVDGAQIFKKCSSCHGQNAQNHALGKSHIIKGWAPSKIIDALHGYKAGTYGGSMKAVMKGQASSLNDSEIKAVAKYISKL